MRALRILVVVMGVMLVGGIAMLIIAIAHRASQPRQPQPGPAPPPAAAPLNAAPIELPPGARVETMAIGADRLVVDVVLADGGRQLLVIDLASGRRLGTIPLPVGH